MKYKHISSLSYKDRKGVRIKAGKLFQKGIPQADVARRVKATPTAANYWHKAWKTQGVQAKDLVE